MDEHREPHTPIDDDDVVEDLAPDQKQAEDVKGGGLLQDAVGNATKSAGEGLASTVRK